MAMANAVGFGGGDTPALPVQPQNGASFAPAAVAPAPVVAPQNNAAFVPPVVTNDTIAPPAAPIAPPVAMAATGAAAHMSSQAPIDVTNGAVQPQAPIVQSPQNGYLPGPQQIQGNDGNSYSAQFGEPVSDPFANAIAGSQKTDAAWK